MLRGFLLESLRLFVRGNDSVNKTAADFQKEDSAFQGFFFLSFIAREDSVINVLSLNGS